MTRVLALSVLVAACAAPMMLAKYGTLPLATVLAPAAELGGACLVEMLGALDAYKPKLLARPEGSSVVVEAMTSAPRLHHQWSPDVVRDASGLAAASDPRKGGRPAGR